MKCTYPECKCPFDMGNAGKCLIGKDSNKTMIEDLEMSNIIVTTCGKCSNIDALTAITKFMLMNYNERRYRRERKIDVNSSVTLIVKEIKTDDELRNCNALFEVSVAA